jgi:hypothetical protein
MKWVSILRPDVGPFGETYFDAGAFVIVGALGKEILWGMG